MIERIYRNKYMATCDNCGTGQEFDTWTDALEYMFEEGWKKRLVDGEFKHYCPECLVHKVLKDGTSKIRGSHNVNMDNPLTASIINTMAETGRKAMKGNHSIDSR